jgi:1-acyl-sn-glycerol-3-phosphate acyltransferase
MNRELCLKNDTYLTPMNLLGQIKTVFAATSIFYPRMIATIFHASFCSMARIYTNKRWIGSSTAMREHLERSGVTINITGMDFIDATPGPVVFISNHMSTLETFVLPALIEPKKHVTFIVKKILISYPVFGPVMSSRDPVVVSRKNPREDFEVVMTDGVKRIREGTSIIVFPQSTRRVEFEAGEFNSLGVKLARRAGVPVVPIALKTDAWSNGSVLKDYGPIYPEKKVYIAFGNPMKIKGTGGEEHKKIIGFIEESLNRWSE